MAIFQANTFLDFLCSTVVKQNLGGGVWHGFIQARCPFCQPTNGVKAMKRNYRNHGDTTVFGRELDIIEPAVVNALRLVTTILGPCHMQPLTLHNCVTKYW